jgi:hypothetical protein
MKTTTCTNHCSACGRHFHSLKAFDHHRTGAYGTGAYGEPVGDQPIGSSATGSEHGRRCLHPLDVLASDGESRFEAPTDNGECRMYDDGSGTRIEHGVTIWTLAKTPAQRQWLASLRG